MNDTLDFKRILKQLDRHDVIWLLSTHHAGVYGSFQIAPSKMVSLGLVHRTMQKSGRNPEYGYTLSPFGHSFCAWLQSAAVNEYLDKHHAND